VGVLAAAVVILWQRERRRKALLAFRQSGLSIVLAMYASIYGASILASISLFDAATPIDDRTMSPVYVSLLALLVAGGWLLPRAVSWRHLRPALALAAAAVGVSFVLRSAGLLRSLSGEPRGYAELSVQQGGGLPEIVALPADVTIYTNNLDVLYFLYGRGGFLVPEPIDPITLEPRDEYASLMESVIDNVDHGALVIMFAVSPGEIDPLIAAGLRVDLERAGVILLSR
jgi:flagellar biosynthesis protein FliQ